MGDLGTYPMKSHISITHINMASVWDTKWFGSKVSSTLFFSPLRPGQLSLYLYLTSFPICVSLWFHKCCSIWRADDWQQPCPGTRSKGDKGRVVTSKSEGHERSVVGRLHIDLCKTSNVWTRWAQGTMVKREGGRIVLWKCCIALTGYCGQGDCKE